MLAYDILFGKGIRCGGRLGAFAKENSSRLFELLEDFQSNEPKNVENASVGKCVFNATVLCPGFAEIQILCVFI